MRYYINDLKGDKFEYRVQQKNLCDINFREVEPKVFQSILLMNGIYYELPEDKINILKEENLTKTEEITELDFRLANIELGL